MALHSYFNAKSVGTLASAGVIGLFAYSYSLYDNPHPLYETDPDVSAQTQELLGTQEKPILAAPQKAVEPLQPPVVISDLLSVTPKTAESADAVQSILSTARSDYRGAQIPPEVKDAYIAASLLTPYPYEYFVQKGFAESTFNAHAFNPNTDARGMFQFTPDSALEVLYDMAQKPQYDGIVPEAQFVTRSHDSAGKAHYGVTKGINTDQLIASATYDPLKSTLMAAEYNTRYLSVLQGKFPDKQLSSLSAYLVHWQGLGGATKILNAYFEKPDEPAYEIFGKKSEVVTNHLSIFYTDGKKQKDPRTTREMLAELEDRGLGGIALGKIDRNFTPAVSATYTQPYNNPEDWKIALSSVAPTESPKPRARPTEGLTEQFEKPAAEADKATEGMTSSPRPKERPLNLIAQNGPSIGGGNG